MGNATSNGFDQTQYVMDGEHQDASSSWPSDVDLTLSETAALSAGDADGAEDADPEEGDDEDEDDDGEAAVADTTMDIPVQAGGADDEPLEGGFISTNKAAYDELADNLELGGGVMPPPEDEMRIRSVVVPVSRNLVPPAIAKEFKLPMLSRKVKDEYDSKWDNSMSECLSTDESANEYEYPVVEYRDKDKLKGGGGGKTPYEELYNSDYSGNSGTDIWTTDEEMYVK